MSVIHVERFLGIAPKINETLLRNEQAQIARDARLWSQALSPLPGPVVDQATDKPTSRIMTLHRYNTTDWLVWTQAVNAVSGPSRNDQLEKLYFSGTDKPRVTTNALYDDGAPGTNVPPASWILGIPAPVGPPVASLGAAGNITGANITWVYTFVRKYSDGWVEESAPSPVSNALSPAAQQVDVTVPNGALTVADYGITHKRLYRLVSGEYLFVTEVAVGTGTANDNAATVDLGDAIDTTDDLPWPDGVIGFIRLPNNCIAGHKDNVVYISEPNKPHATRLVNQYVMNSEIVGLGNVDTTIVAITIWKPEIGRGKDPAGYDFVAQAGSFPCSSARSIASSELGVFWATTRGLALSDGVTVDICTSDFISRKEWKEQFRPDTIHGTVHDGRYYGWYETGVDVNGNPVGAGFIVDRSEAAFMSQMGEYVYAAQAVPETDDMYVVKRNPNAGDVNYTYKWEADPSNPIVYEWKSKVFISNGLENFGFAQVIASYGDGLNDEEIIALQAEIASVEAFNDALTDTDGCIGGNEGGYAIADGAVADDNQTLLAPDPDYIAGVVTFRYWVDGTLVLEKDVESNEPFALPAGRLGEQHEFSVSGAVEVDEVTICGSPDELASV